MSKGKNSIKYNNHIYGIFYSFFKPEFYQYVAYHQKGYGLKTIILILFFSFFIPTLIIYKSFSTFDFVESKNEKIIKIRDSLSNFPKINIISGKLDKEQNPILPVVINGASENNNLITIDPDKNSLVATNSLILFSKEGVFFDSIEIISYLLNIFGYNNIPINQMKVEASFINYNNENITIDSNLVESTIQLYVNNLGRNLLFSVLPITFVISILLKIIEIFALSLVTSLLLKRKKLVYSYKKIFAITAAALIPSLFLKSIDAISMWSSNIIGNSAYGGLIILAINFYFISFAVTAISSKKTN